MPPDALAGLQGASEVQAVEAGGSGAAEALEVPAGAPLRRCSGDPGSVALSWGQTGIPGSA